MSATTTATPARSDVAAKALSLAAAALAAVGATLTGLAVGGGSKLLVVMPLAIGVSVLLGVIALTRFGAYVFLMLLMRSSVDLAKLSGPAAGSTAENGAATRGADPSSILAAIFLIAAAMWLAAQYRAGGGKLPGSPLRRALCVFALGGVLSIAGSGQPAVSAVESLRIISVVAMFAVLEQMMRDREATLRVLLAVFLSLAAPLLYTAGGFLLGMPPAESKGSFTRITGTFTQSNTFGRYLMVMLVFSVAVYPHLSRRAKTFLVPAIVLSSVFLLLTYTRTALLGTVLGLIVVGVLQSKRVLIGLAVIAIAALIFVPQLASRFSVLTSTETVSAGRAPSGNSLEWRVSYWSKVLPLANQNPVTGIGLNQTQYQTSKAKQPHSDFVRAYVETGLLGLAAYLVMLCSLLATGWRAVRASPETGLDRGIAVGFLGCATAFVAVSVAANVMSNVVTLWYLVAFGAAAVGVTYRSEHSVVRPAT